MEKIETFEKNLPKGEGDCKEKCLAIKGSKSETNKDKPIPEKDKHSQ